jgi:nicotinamide-nucleotide amidase
MTTNKSRNSMFEAEVISVGDELTSGQRLDTNSQWLSQRLGEIGVKTTRHTTVGDDLQANIDAFRQAATRARFVIISGGLGPTLDDLTREAMAEAFNRPLELHEPSLEHIESMFAKRQRPMPERNRVQAMLPASSEPIPNPHGTAPGVDLCVTTSPDHRCRLFALPGVPAELKQMWTETVEPRIESEIGNTQGQLRYHAVKVYGIGESDVEVKLPTLIARDRIPTVGITVSRATITLRIAARSLSDAEFQRLIAPTLEEIESALGDLIFGTGEDELEHAVARQLVKQGLTLASLEIGASSLITDWMLAASPETGRFFAGGIAFPTVQQAAMWLHRSASNILDAESTDALLQSGELNEKACGELAELVRARFDANIGLAFGVYPTPNALSESSRVFEVVYAISILTSQGNVVQTEKRSLAGHPEVVTARIAKTALDIVRRKLLG